MEKQKRETQNLFSREYEIAKRIIEAYDRIHYTDRDELARIIESHKDKQHKSDRISVLMRRHTADVCYLQGVEIFESVQIRTENGVKTITRN